MAYSKSKLLNIKNFDEIYDMLINNCANPDTRFHPTAGDFSFLVNFEEELELFMGKAFQWKNDKNILVGIAWPDHRGTHYICTRQTDPKIYDVILNDIEAGVSGSDEIWLWNCETDTAKQDVLKHRGYGTNGWYMFYGHKSLDNFIPKINLPDGYTIRELADTDISAKADLMGVSMGDIEDRTPEKYRSMQKSMVYDKRTDLVVVDKKNTVVAFINGWLDVQNKMGVIEPCGTSHEHSGKGLMTNLMNHLFMIYKRIGITDVYIPHGGLCTYEDENDDAMRLYKKMGFKEVYKMFVRIKNYDLSKHDEYENQAYKNFYEMKNSNDRKV